MIPNKAMSDHIKAYNKWLKEKFPPNGDLPLIHSDEEIVINRQISPAKIKGFNIRQLSTGIVITREDTNE